MSRRVEDLEGAELALWVARADGRETELLNGVWYVDSGGDFMMELALFKPYEDWAQGGPIIERERINLEHDGCYALIDGDRDGPTFREEGRTILEAAMRAFVASKYGETLPEVTP